MLFVLIHWCLIPQPHCRGSPPVKNPAPFISQFSDRPPVPPRRHHPGQIKYPLNHVFTPIPPAPEKILGVGRLEPLFFVTCKLPPPNATRTVFVPRAPYNYFPSRLRPAPWRPSPGPRAPLKWGPPPFPSPPLPPREFGVAPGADPRSPANPINPAYCFAPLVDLLALLCGMSGWPPLLSLPPCLVV